MKPIHRTSAAMLVVAHAFAQAQSAPEPMQKVVVSALTNARAASTTTAIIVSRDQLLRHGDATLSDVLKRQPGITVEARPGKPPAIRMRGMGSGYTAILLNGLPAPGGFSLESLSPDLIERIEILRSPSAEISGQAIAGAINVILRRAHTRTGESGGEVKAGASVVGGYLAPQVFAQHSGQLGALAYSLSTTFKRDRNPVRAQSTEEHPGSGVLRRTAIFDNQISDMLEVAPRMSWQPNARDTVTSRAYIRQRHIDNAKFERETALAGGLTGFPHADSSYEARPLNAYGDLAWTRRFESGARFSAKLAAFYTARKAEFAYRGMDVQDRLKETHLVASGPIERELTFNGTWRRPLWDSHSLAAGWEFGRKQRSEYRREHQSSPDGATLLRTDEAYRAQVVRAAFFVQDEWDVSPELSVYLGVRREDLRTTGQGNAHAPVDVDAGAWSPIVQAVFKPHSGKGSGDVVVPRDQFRFAIARTYKAPQISQLLPRRYTVDNNNSATNHDFQGNPNLRPELALGVDLAWERYIGKHDFVSLSAYHKRISDITLSRVYQRDGVWIGMPENQGTAVVRGVELEMKAVRGPLSVRMNLARNWSRVESVPGPDNHIADQPAFTGNVGLDYAAPGGSLDVGGSYGYRGRIAYRLGSDIFNSESVKRQLDLYAVWKRDSRSRLRLSVSDLLGQDYRERSAYQSESLHSRTTDFRVHPALRLMWEQAL